MVRFLRPFHSAAMVVAFLLTTNFAQARTTIDPVPPAIASSHFLLSVGKQQSPVAHAATSYYFANFTVKRTVHISVTAEKDGYWNKGVEVQPWRWGIRPSVSGRTISFTIDQPMKLSISRPGDHGATAEMLFLFANAPEREVPKKGLNALRYYGPGIYHENIDAKDNESIYLAPGALIFGSLNVWGVQNVKVFGRGTIVYDGPQNPTADEGWMHKPNWHVVVMDHARNIQISGITLIVRSRTWMIQMLSSRGVTFDNVKVIGGCPGNANQDGMDWLGGGDTVVRDSFFRASDDIFALYGNWLGYDAKAITTPGETVAKIQIENSVLSTSISNVVRVSWPQKIFDSHHFALKNSDIIHMGMGGCKVPFGLLEIWDDPSGKGEHSDYKLENIRLENWYSLLQLRQQSPSIRNVSLTNIWALETPSLVPSVLSGDVRDVRLRNIRLPENNNDLPIQREFDASLPAMEQGTGPHAAFTVDAKAIYPGQSITFDASSSSGTIKEFLWTFGDGAKARGKIVRHAFPDTKGTYQDGSGAFRVLLKVADKEGEEDWASAPVILADDYLPAVADSPSGLLYRYFEGSDLQLTKLAALQPASTGTITNLTIEQRKRPEAYAFTFDGVLNAPSDGGYLFQVLGNDAGELTIDGRSIARSPDPKAQVCGMTGNMVQLTTGTIGLRAGKHAVHIAMTHGKGPDGFAVKWQASGKLLQTLWQ